MPAQARMISPTLLTLRARGGGQLAWVPAQVRMILLRLKIVEVCDEGLLERLHMQVTMISVRLLILQASGFFQLAWVPALLVVIPRISSTLRCCSGRAAQWRQATSHSGWVFGFGRRSLLLNVRVQVLWVHAEVMLIPLGPCITAKVFGVLRWVRTQLRMISSESLRLQAMGFYQVAQVRKQVMMIFLGWLILQARWVQSQAAMLSLSQLILQAHGFGILSRERNQVAMISLRLLFLQAWMVDQLRAVRMQVIMIVLQALTIQACCFGKLVWTPAHVIMFWLRR